MCEVKEAHLCITSLQLQVDFLVQQDQQSDECSQNN